MLEAGIENHLRVGCEMDSNIGRMASKIGTLGRPKSAPRPDHNRHLGPAKIDTFGRPKSAPWGNQNRHPWPPNTSHGRSQRLGHNPIKRTAEMNFPYMEMLIHICVHMHMYARMLIYAHIHIRRRAGGRIYTCAHKAVERFLERLWTRSVLTTNALRAELVLFLGGALGMNLWETASRGKAMREVCDHLEKKKSAPGATSRTQLRSPRWRPQARGTPFGTAVGAVCTYYKRTAG